MGSSAQIYKYVLSAYFLSQLSLLPRVNGQMGSSAQELLSRFTLKHAFIRPQQIFVAN
jgi:hypothetical protein